MVTTNSRLKSSFNIAPDLILFLVYSIKILNRSKKNYKYIYSDSKNIEVISPNALPPATVYHKKDKTVYFLCENCEPSSYKHKIIYFHANFHAYDFCKKS